MSIEQKIAERSNNICELTGETENLNTYHVKPGNENDSNSYLYLSEKCIKQLENKETFEPHFWRFIPDVMWSELPPIKIIAWRILNRLKDETWAADALDILYLDEEQLEWAKAGGALTETEQHKDCNGAILQTGDSVTLIKSLDVKGSSVNAKIGTPVRNIRLVPDNAEQIEGKIDGQKIIILTKYVKKSG